MATMTTRDETRAARDAARQAALAAEQRYGRASHVVQWGSEDPREQAVAHRDIHMLRADVIDARAAAEVAERAFVQASSADAEARAPHHRRAQQARVREVVELAERLVALGAEIEAAHDAARKDCCIGGTWFGPHQASDRSVAEICELMRIHLPPWRARMERAGWLG